MYLAVQLRVFIVRQSNNNTELALPVAFSASSQFPLVRVKLFQVCGNFGRSYAYGKREKIFTRLL